jgi:phage protein D
LELDIENLDYRWLNEWYPDENAKLLVGIVQTENGKPRFLDLGSFYVDEPTFNNQRLSLKCLALPLDQTIREQVNSVAWEKITLKELISKIATKHELNYELHCDDIFFDRLDQDRETDLSFLKRILSETALSLKVTDDKLIVFNDDALIDNDNIDVFSIKDPRIRSFTLKKKNQGIYDKVEVSYYDADKKKHIVETITKEELEKRNEVKNA